MKITPIKTISFTERVSFFEFSDNHQQYVIDSKTGAYYILDNKFDIKSVFKLPYERSQASAIHPNKPLAAIMDGEALYITDFEGEELWKKEGRYISACWNLDGSLLYSLLRLDSDNLELQIVSNSGDIAAAKIFKDELYESSALLTVIPNTNNMVLQLMAGQDGCVVYFVKQNGDNIEMQILHEIFSYTAVSFNPAATEFLCIENDESTIHRFTYPGLKEKGVFDFYKECEDECNLDTSLIHLGEKAIISYGENYYMLDTETMSITDKLMIEGHEPVPVSTIYKNLNDKEFICDIDYLSDAGSYIFIHVNHRIANDIIVINKNDII